MVSLWEDVSRLVQATFMTRRGVAGRRRSAKQTGVS